MASLIERYYPGGQGWWTQPRKVFLLWWTSPSSSVIMCHQRYVSLWICMDDIIHLILNLCRHVRTIPQWLVVDRNPSGSSPQRGAWRREGWQGAAWRGPEGPRGGEWIEGIKDERKWKWKEESMLGWGKKDWMDRCLKCVFHIFHVSIVFHMQRQRTQIVSFGEMFALLYQKHGSENDSVFCLSV